MPNDDEWDAFADSSEEEEAKPVKKEAAKPVAGADDSSDGGWEDEEEAPKKPKAKVNEKDESDGGGWEDASDDEDEKAKEKLSEDAQLAERNKDLAAKPAANWDDESDVDEEEEDPNKQKGPLEREKGAKESYGKRLKEQKRIERAERVAREKKERSIKRAEALADPSVAATIRSYTEDNALLFGGDQKQTGWQDLDIKFMKKPLGFSIDPSKRVRKLQDQLAKKGLTKGAIIVTVRSNDRPPNDVTGCGKDQVLGMLKSAIFPLTLTFYNPPYDDALLSSDDAKRLQSVKVVKKLPVGGKISLKDYPLGCPGDFKKFGTLIGKMVRRSRFNDKGECVMPFLKEVLSLALMNLEVDEIGQAQSHLNRIWQSANRKRSGGKKKSKFNPKDEVEANYQDTGEWYKALVVEVVKGGKYRVKYPDYDNELEVVPEIRLREPKKKMDKYKHKFEEEDFDFLDD